MAGVASIMPFIALMSDPTALKSSMIGRFLPVDQAMPPIHVVGLVVLGLFVLTNVLSMLNLWLSVRFSALLGVRLSEDMAESYFSKGYLYLSAQSSVVLANNITRETEKLAICGVLQLCIMISKLIQLVMIAGLLIFISPMFMATFSTVSLLLYFIFYQLMKKRLVLAGSEAVKAIGQASREANEMFSAVKELLLRGSSRFFIESIRSSVGRYFKADAIGRVMPVLPKYLIEMVAFSTLLMIPIYQSLVGLEYRGVLPVMALFAFAGYRILPSLQQAYSSFSILKYYDTLAAQFVGVLNSRIDKPTKSESSKVSEFKDAIRLNQVSFCYPGNENPAISGANLVIRRGQKVAIIGPSGAGKSTLLDILLGLLAPTKGTLIIDGLAVGASVIPWDKRAIGYVPQSPLLIRATIAQNIALGLAEEEIDWQRCKTVAEFACINEVIERFSDGFDTLLGDGVSLSGGEAQRLAIARALYFAPALLVLDEPTSALDPMISSRLVANLCSSKFESTVLVVTHDWGTLASFDQIVLVDQAKIVAAGSFSSVSEQVKSIRNKVESTSVIANEGRR